MSPFPTVTRRIALAVALLAAAACERPTAPLVSSNAPTAQSAPVRNPAQDATLLRQRIQQVLEWNHIYPRDSITVERDGHVEHYIATVVEREYDPPAGVSGRPFVRRLLIGWNGDLHRGFVITSNDSVADVSPRKFALSDSSAPRPWARIARVDVNENEAHDHWIGSSGQLRIVRNTRADNCPGAIPQFGTVANVGEYIEEMRAYDDCGRYRYRVALSAELDRESAQPATAFSRWFSHTTSIRIPEQELPGTYFVQHCPAFPSTLVFACDVFNFNRAPTDFAASFSQQFTLDLAHLVPTDEWAMGYTQTLARGEGNLIACCRGYPGPVQYTVYSPNGAVLKTAKLASAQQDSLIRGLPLILPNVRYNGRTIFYVRSLGSYRPAIVDLTILPCPGVTDARDALQHMSLGPIAGCRRPTDARR